MVSVVTTGFPMRFCEDSSFVTSYGTNCITGLINGRSKRFDVDVILSGKVRFVGSDILTPLPDAQSTPPGSVPSGAHNGTGPLPYILSSTYASTPILLSTKTQAELLEESVIE